MTKKFFTALLAAMIVASALAGCQNVPSPIKSSDISDELSAQAQNDKKGTELKVLETAPMLSAFQDPTAKKYLNEYFGISLPDEVLTVKQWEEAVNRTGYESASYFDELADEATEISSTAEKEEFVSTESASEATSETPVTQEATAKTEPESVDQNSEITIAEALKSAVIAANFEELALTYTVDEAKEKLAEQNIKIAEKSSAYSQYLLTALNTGLIDEAGALAAGADKTLDEKTATAILMATEDAKGQARNFLGYSSDKDIYAKLNNAWSSFMLFDDEKLSALGESAVQMKVTTGYSLKNDRFNARFLPELTLQYGHSDIKHAHQLIGLLKSENIVAKVQLEPKISVFEYLLEWGSIPEPTPYCVVKQTNDNLYLSYAVEYDLQLEFVSIEDKLAFDQIVEKHAKKYVGNEDGKGLLFASCWQPFYTSHTEMTGDRYHLIYDNVIRNGDFTIHPFSLEEDSAAVSEKLKQIDPTLTVQPVKLWCNDAFYRYLRGED